MSKNIAIIGSGIAGLTSAYLLNKEHNIRLYEANDYIGGHTATKDVTVNGNEFAIDTGFIVFNDWTYPNFIKLIKQLGVQYQESEMSFSVSNKATDIEYNGHDLNSLFAQRRNLIRPRFWLLVNAIVRFNKLCKATLGKGVNTDGITLQQFLQDNQFSEDFSQHYILPMCAAIWSASLAQARTFPLTFFLQFFSHHGLLNIADRPQWYTITGGSSRYIEPLIADFKDKIKLNTPVQQVATIGNQVAVTTQAEGEVLYDHVIFACHSDQALAMLATPSEDQQRILGAIPFAANKVTMHNDIDQLPKRKLAWASWNYRLEGHDKEQTHAATVTYNMNILQSLVATAPTFCVSLNTDNIAQETILGQYDYAHPQFSPNMVKAQQQRQQICGVNNMHFVGAYWYNGFHEDGVRSALDVCQKFGAKL
jgi:predicted NAD/FAD-binding protein